MTSAPLSTTAELPAFRSFIRLESINRQRNRYRFFILQWQPGLWDARVLVRVWGRIGTPGRTQVVGTPEQSNGDYVVPQLLRRRRRHGYTVVAWQ